MKTMNRWLGLTLVFAFLLLGATTAKLEAADKIKFQLDWIIEGKHVPFYVARDGGFFEKNGLEVTLLEGKGSANSSTFVDLGQADYSYGDFLTAVQVMSKGGKNRAIGVGMTFNGGGFIFLESAGIKTAKDLEGKSFGTNPSDFAYILLPAAAAASGFDANKVVIKTMEPAVRTPALFEVKSISCPAPTVPAFNGWRSSASARGRASSTCFLATWASKATAMCFRRGKTGSRIIPIKCKESSPRSSTLGPGRLKIAKRPLRFS